MDSIVAIVSMEIEIRNDEFKKINLLLSFASISVPLFLSLIVDMTGLQVASAAGLSGAAATQDNAASFGSRSVAGVEPNPNISRHNEAHLAQFLLTNYNPAARPVRNISSTTVLQISFYIVQILKLVSLFHLSIITNSWPQGSPLKPYIFLLTRRFIVTFRQHFVEGKLKVYHSVVFFSKSLYTKSVSPKAIFFRVQVLTTLEFRA